MDGLLGSGLWGVVVVLGPLLLGLAIFWALRHNKQSAQEFHRTEQATRELYDGDPVDRREG